MRFSTIQKCWIIISLPLLLITSCKEDSNEKIVGSGRLTSETRQMDFKAVKAIELNGFFNVSFSTRRNTSTICVTAEDNIIPYIATTQANGVITISSKEGYTLHNNQDINIDIKSLSVKDLYLNGNGTFTVDTIQGIDPKITINGSGTLKISNFRCDNLDAVIDGNGTMSLNGTLPSLKTTINGSGQTTVNAITKKIYATINGTGIVRYKGTPVVVLTNIGTGEQVIKF